MSDTTSPAEIRFGYEFGVDGIVNRKEAERLLGVKERTIRNYAREGFIRVGYRRPRKPASGLVVCLRSIKDHIRSLER